MNISSETELKDVMPMVAGMIYSALGWQGGTISQVLDEIDRLRESETTQEATIQGLVGATQIQSIQLAETVSLLAGYEQWEADILCTGDCWRTDSGLPIMTQQIYDAFLELQKKRNEVLEKHPQSLLETHRLERAVIEAAKRFFSPGGNSQRWSELCDAVQALEALGAE